METIVSKNCLPEPENEAQQRELGRVGDPDQRQEAERPTGANQATILPTSPRGSY